jgi:imidazolonepropionase-like amidohydrolase
MSLRCGVVWDGAGHAFQDGRIVWQGERITRSGPAAAVSAAPGELDLRPAFCMPGLVDAHTHVTSYVSSPGDDVATRRRAAADNARRTLEAGVTAGRDLGDDSGDGLWIRDEINAGRLPGPRLQVACEQIGIDPAQRAATPAALRAVVREHVQRGCDVIKLFATSGIGGNERFLSREQMAAAVEEAHHAGRRVAVHVVAHDAVADVVAAGADSAEHATGTDAALAKEMKRRGVVLVPTLYILRYYVEDAANIGYGAEHVARLEHAIDSEVRPLERRFPSILRAGVRVAAGSDSFMKLHGRNASEMVWLVKAGMSPEQALAAMTHASAELMGWQDRVGSLAPGHYADVLVLDGDPRADISRVQAEHVRAVWKGGQPVKRAEASWQP